MRRTAPPDRLTLDVLAAQAAGLSYGMYKALHPYTGEWEPLKIEPEDDGRQELTCQHCGKIFVAYGYDTRRKYCSDLCRREAAYAAYRERHPAVMVPCAVCGGLFPRRSGKKYCSDGCKVKGYRQHQAASNARRPRKRKEKT